MEEERRQFDVKEFISNEETPVETRAGKRVRIITAKRNHLRYPIVGDILYEEDDDEPILVAWGPNGKYYQNGSSDDGRDLFFSIEIKKKTTRRMTIQELAWWLGECPGEHREFKNSISLNAYVCRELCYTEIESGKECSPNIVIRSNGGEWHEPLIKE